MNRRDVLKGIAASALLLMTAGKKRRSRGMKMKAGWLSARQLEIANIDACCKTVGDGYCVLVTTNGEVWYSEDVGRTHIYLDTLPMKNDEVAYLKLQEHVFTVNLARRTKSGSQRSRSWIYGKLDFDSEWERIYPKESAFQ